MKIKLHKKIGSITKRKTVKIGFSWTTLFFGYFVPLFRGMPPSYFIKVAIFSLFTLGLAQIYYGAKINEDFYEHLLDEGWQDVIE